MVFEIMKAAYVRLSSQIQRYEQVLKAFPDGELVYWRNGKGYKHFVKINGEKKYLPLTRMDIITQLAGKKILEQKLKSAQNECTAINQYLKKHKEPDDVQSGGIYDQHLEELTRGLFAPKEETLKKWAEAEYPSTAGYPENLVHPGPEGRMYRSKSEAIIAYVLHDRQIPFRYECDKEINKIRYPIDFTIRHPESGKVIYWEHFGMVDNERYMHRLGNKLRDYESAGIFPGRNLIMTFESHRFPFSMGTAEDTVENWFPTIKK